jgi:hypothetical protein
MAVDGAARGGRSGEMCHSWMAVVERTPCRRPRWGSGGPPPAWGAACGGTVERYEGDGEAGGGPAWELRPLPARASASARRGAGGRRWEKGRPGSFCGWLLRAAASARCGGREGAGEMETVRREVAGRREAVVREGADGMEAVGLGDDGGKEGVGQEADGRGAGWGKMREKRGGGWGSGGGARGAATV